jgi:hypothetical protein
MLARELGSGFEGSVLVGAADSQTADWGNVIIKSKTPMAIRAAKSGTGPSERNARRTYIASKPRIKPHTQKGPTNFMSSSY